MKDLVLLFTEILIAARNHVPMGEFSSVKELAFQTLCIKSCSSNPLDPPLREGIVRPPAPSSVRKTDFINRTAFSTLLKQTLDFTSDEDKVLVDEFTKLWAQSLQSTHKSLHKTHVSNAVAYLLSKYLTALLLGFIFRFLLP